MNTQLICGSMALCLLLHGFLPFLSGDFSVGYDRAGLEESLTSVMESFRDDRRLNEAGGMSEKDDREFAVVFNYRPGVYATPEIQIISMNSARPQKFEDVPDDSPYKEAIYWAVERKITNGTTTTTFSPNDNCKRKHIIMFIWRGCGKKYDDAWTYPFSADTELGGDFARAATWAFYCDPRLEGGIFLYDDPTQRVFQPNKECDRGEAVIYLWKLAGCPQADLTFARNFTDISQLIGNDTSEAYYRELPSAVAWAVEQGITNGYKDGTFKPRNICTRGQIVTFLYRFSATEFGKTAL